MDTQQVQEKEYLSWHIVANYLIFAQNFELYGKSGQVNIISRVPLEIIVLGVGLIGMSI